MPEHMQQLLIDKTKSFPVNVSDHKLQDFTFFMRYLNDEHWTLVLNDEWSNEDAIRFICGLLSDLGMINGSCPTFRQAATFCALIKDGANFCKEASSEILYERVRYFKKKFIDRHQRLSAITYGRHLPSDPAEYLKQYPALIKKVYQSGLPVSPKVTEDDVSWYARRFPLRKPKTTFNWNSVGENRHGMMENMLCMMMQNTMMQLKPSAALARNMKPMMQAMEDAPVRMTPAPSGVLALEDKPCVIPAAEMKIIKRKKTQKASCCANSCRSHRREKRSRC